MVDIFLFLAVTSLQDGSEIVLGSLVVVHVTYPQSLGPPPRVHSTKDLTVLHRILLFCISSRYVC